MGYSLYLGQPIVVNEVYGLDTSYLSSGLIDSSEGEHTQIWRVKLVRVDRLLGFGRHDKMVKI
jgi:hypothetical protein